MRVGYIAILPYSSIYFANTVIWQLRECRQFFGVSICGNVPAQAPMCPILG